MSEHLFKVGIILLFLTSGMGLSAQNPGLLPGRSGPSEADTTKILRKWTDLAYGNLSEAQKLDVYLPDTGEGPFPVLFYIHGGGFMMGSRKSGELTPVLEGLNRGYAVVSADYRLSKEAPFPAAVKDLKEALDWVKNQGAKYRLEGKKIAVWGSSAGGNLAALMGTSAGNQPWEKSLDTGTDLRVQAVIDWYGPVWFSTMDEEFQALGVTPKMGTTNRAASPESVYLGKTVGTPEAEPLVKAASPVTYIDPSDPPFFIQHGDADANIPYTQSRRLADELSAVLGSDKVIFEILQGASHGGEAFTSLENLAKVFSFLDRHLK